jgi:hypothetical protein
LKLIFNVENNLSLQAQANFSKSQEILFEQFLNNPNDFIQNSRKIGEMPHMDGVCERWEVWLDKNFLLYLDCNVPTPWGTTEQYYGTVMVFGYKISGQIYLATN